MATEAVMVERQGERLHRVLSSYLKFLENVYGLMRFLESEVTKRDWEMVKNGGYAITRNGFGSGLASFGSADWSPNYIGIAFMPAGRTTTDQGVTKTKIGEGLDVLYFQVRWLDRSPGEPTVWHGRLRVTADSSAKEARKWEEYQNQAFRRIEAANNAALHGPIRQIKITPGGTSITVTGDYSIVPVTELLNEQDVVAKLIVPALGTQP